MTKLQVLLSGCLRYRDPPQLSKLGAMEWTLLCHENFRSHMQFILEDERIFLVKLFAWRHFLERNPTESHQPSIFVAVGTMNISFRRGIAIVCLLCSTHPLVYHNRAWKLFAFFLVFLIRKTYEVTEKWDSVSHCKPLDWSGWKCIITFSLLVSYGHLSTWHI